MTEKKKYKIVYDRNNCIGAASCAAVQPERWIISTDDSKADLVDSKKVTKDGVEMWELEFTEEELEKFIESAEVCPVDVICVYDPDGNKIA